MVQCVHPDPLPAVGFWITQNQRDIGHVSLLEYEVLWWSKEGEEKLSLHFQDPLVPMWHGKDPGRPWSIPEWRTSDKYLGPWQRYCCVEAKWLVDNSYREDHSVWGLNMSPKQISAPEKAGLEDQVWRTGHQTLMGPRSWATVLACNENRWTRGLSKEGREGTTVPEPMCMDLRSSLLHQQEIPSSLPHNTWEGREWEGYTFIQNMQG